MSARNSFTCFGSCLIIFGRHQLWNVTITGQIPAKLSYNDYVDTNGIMHMVSSCADCCGVLRTFEVKLFPYMMIQLSNYIILYILMIQLSNYPYTRTQLRVPYS